MLSPTDVYLYKAGVETLGERVKSVQVDHDTRATSLRHSGAFIVKSEQISHIVLFVLLTLNKEMSAGNIFKVVIDLVFFAFLLTFS